MLTVKMENEDYEEELIEGGLLLLGLGIGVAFCCLAPVKQAFDTSLQRDLGNKFIQVC